MLLTHILGFFDLDPGLRPEPPLGLERLRPATGVPFIITPGVTGFDVSEFTGDDASNAGVVTDTTSSGPGPGAGDFTSSSTLLEVFITSAGVASLDDDSLPFIFNLTISDGLLRPFDRVVVEEGEPIDELSGEDDIVFDLDQNIPSND